MKFFVEGRNDFEYHENQKEIMQTFRGMKWLNSLVGILALLIVVLSINDVRAQNMGSSGEDYYTDQYLRLDNHVYAQNVKTVLFHPKDWPLAAPIVELNDATSLLELHFDVLDSALGNFMYTIIHCNADWNQSDLEPHEYIDGPFEDYLTEFEFSRLGFQRYIHYSLEIPNFSMRITKSGNYILHVFDADDTERSILTRRFCITENLISVDAEIHQPVLVNRRYSHQEIDFNLDLQSYSITNPFNDLHVVILQNHSWENALTGLKPRFVKQNVLDYDHDGNNTIEGGNEFRMLDIKNNRFVGEGIERVSYVNSENHAYLEMDKSRLSLSYLQRRDLNGWFFIRNDLFGGNAHTTGDYVNVHFSLKQPKPIADGDVYIYGALTDWKIIPEAKMSFNQVTLRYENTLYLKQGLYNYMYAYVKDGDVQADLNRFEGSHFQTENEYIILVYHRPIGTDFDRLIKAESIGYPANN